MAKEMFKLALFEAKFTVMTAKIKSPHQSIVRQSNLVFSALFAKYLILLTIVLMNPLYQSLNKKQLQAVENLEGPILIVAGAGSGKTRTLTSRLAAILASGVEPESIVAITFTNKAAEEMRNRVDKLRGLNNLFIGTFHSLGARILKNEAKFVGRTPNFSIFDGDDSLRLIKTIVKNLNFSEYEKRKKPILYFYGKNFHGLKVNYPIPRMKTIPLNSF